MAGILLMKKLSLTADSDRRKCYPTLRVRPQGSPSGQRLRHSCEQMPDGMSALFGRAACAQLENKTQMQVLACLQK